ncbi:MAG: hypothetical protein IH991_05565 [Planctomycetes bacterium]|nr:hypothetical protein [Planctomycetota bacterium]
MRRIQLFGALCAGLLIFSSTVSADEPKETVPLQEAATSAKATFQPMDSETSQAAKESLLATLKRFDDYLTYGGTRKRNGWRRYLQLEVVEKALQEDPVDLRVVNRSLEKFRAYHSGLERSEFTELRDAMFAYRNAAYFSTTKNIKDQYTFNLEQLSKRLATYAETPNLADASLIGRTIGWLESGAQAESLIKDIRQRYRHPNLFARVSSRFVAAAMESDIDENSGIYDQVGNMSLTGSAHTRARITAVLIPDDDRAYFEIQMLGVANSNTTGSVGPVTIYTTGTTSIDGRKHVMIDADGLHSHPAIAFCVTETNVYALDAPLLIRKIAWRQVSQRKNSSEVAASRKAAGQIAWRMDSQGGEMLAKANEYYNEQFRKPLMRRGEFPQLMKFSTTSDHLFVTMRQANAFQIAAPSEPPSITGDPDLVVRIHESLVSNISEAALGGITLSNAQMREAIRKLLGKVPEELKAGPDTETLSISFSTAQPISLEFADQTVKITIRGRRFTRGKQIIRDAMSVTARYKIELADGGLKLVVVDKTSGLTLLFPHNGTPAGSGIKTTHSSIGKHCVIT